MIHNIGDEVQFNIGAETLNGIVYSVNEDLYGDDITYDIVTEDTDGNKTLYEAIPISIVY